MATRETRMITSDPGNNAQHRCHRCPFSQGLWAWNVVCINKYLKKQRRRIFLGHKKMWSPNLDCGGHSHTYFHLVCGCFHAARAGLVAVTETAGPTELKIRPPRPCTENLYWPGVLKTVLVGITYRVRRSHACWSVVGGALIWVW